MHRQLSARMHSALARCCAVTAPRSANTAAARALSLPTGLNAAIRTCCAAPHLPRAPPVQLQQLPTAPATAAATGAAGRSNGPEFSLDECALELQRATPGVSLTDVLEALQLCALPVPADRYWMLVQCGVWEVSDDWAGATPGAPARAVLCFTPPYGKNGNRAYNVYAFALNYEGIPNGEMFYSPSEFERMTNKASSRKFNTSCRVLFNGRELCTVQRFIQAHFGDGAIHIPKRARANRSPQVNSVQLRQSSTDNSSSSSTVQPRSDNPSGPSSVQLRSGAAGSISASDGKHLGKITGSASYNNSSNTGTWEGNSPQSVSSVQWARGAGSTSDAPVQGLGKITGSASNNSNSNTGSRSRSRRRKPSAPEA